MNNLSLIWVLAAAICLPQPPSEVSWANELGSSVVAPESVPPVDGAELEKKSDVAASQTGLAPRLSGGLLPGTSPKHSAVNVLLLAATTPLLRTLRTDEVRLQL